jgi:hypothetical protein
LRLRQQRLARRLNAYRSKDCTDQENSKLSQPHV